MEKVLQTLIHMPDMKFHMSKAAYPKPQMKHINCRLDIPSNQPSPTEINQLRTSNSQNF